MSKIDDSQRVVPVELLPCPFCNAEPAYFSGTNIQYGHGESSDYAGVRCSVCRVEISFCNYAGYQLTERMALAAEKWNRRSASPPVAPVVGDRIVITLQPSGVQLPIQLRADGTWESADRGDGTPYFRHDAPIAAAQERVSCWRLITPVAPHAWIDGLPPTRDDAEMEAEKRLGWSVELAYSRPPAQTPPATPEDRRDGERLDWLMRQVRGDEFRRIGIHTSAGCTRAAIDAARDDHEGV